MLFFVEGRVRKSGPYILKPEIVNHRGLIEAVDAKQAARKYEKHWNDQTQEYNVYYFVLDYKLTETIT
jgi:hypothetical protein